MAIRPRRSVLYMPGSNERALEKARSLPADGLIFDLEDSVAPEAKALARRQVTDAVKAGGFGHRELIVRVNGLDSEWASEDIAAVAHCGADAILFPKIQSAADVLQAILLLEQAGAPQTLPVWIMAETPRCILNIESIAGASRRLGCVVAGTSDLGRELRIRDTPARDGVFTALSLIVLAARALGVDAIDGVHLDLADEAGFAASCRQGRDLGFDGKTLIHPKQIEGANRGFAPSEAELDWARTIAAAFKDARAQGKGIVVVNGRLVEKLHVDEAERLIALNAAIMAAGERAVAA
ncbi:HpcH/HpaI aldolase/citrate lyase family protein [Dongia sedimenti]|uniref:CoA ester lyase n=1 Tax=Dongia sedimenti TaxID=3064282 RepID=A0ABU0YS98_9PROT|nr:CoA ester lyase [Rhodospirillaceae bacterium R-7]